MIIKCEFHQSLVFMCPFCTLVNFACFFINGIFKTFEIPSECQTVWIQIRLNILLPVHVTYQTLHGGTRSFREVINFTSVANSYTYKKHIPQLK